MQPIIEKIYQNSISDAEKFKAMFLDDTRKEYYVYAWVQNNIILYLGYGKDTEYLDHKPKLEDGVEAATTEISLTAAFPYKDLTEKEAFVLSKYEKIKIENFGMNKLSDIGVLT